MNSTAAGQPYYHSHSDCFLFNNYTRRWRKTAEGHWTGVMKGRVWTLTQTEDTLWYHVYKNQERQSKTHDRKRKNNVSVQEDKPKKKFKTEIKKEDGEPPDVTLLQDYGEEKEMLRDYFQLDVNLGDLYKKWGDADPHFRCIANVFTGLCVWLVAILLHDVW